jgi:DNA-binding transcriptional MerR regulator/DNA gyrase inhibitor GyrI
MNKPVAIHKLSAQVGLTSRTLRHWESEGLFKSLRDADSGWRVYDEEAIMRVQITAFLRELDIPIKEIKTVVNELSFIKLQEIIKNKISSLKTERTENQFKENQLVSLLSFLQEHGNMIISEDNLPQILTNIRFDYKKEDFSLSNSINTDSKVKFITLPPMRVVYNIAVSVSPEEEAMKPVIDWIKSVNLTGTARIFGGNMPPMPRGDDKPYGYGICASIPDGVSIPSHLKEMRLPGGLYAMLESSDDISSSWKNLMKHLAINNKYKSDRSRLCLEEHIRNDNPEGCGNEYSLNLLEPIKQK